MDKFNAIVGQSGGPTAAINATLSGVIRGFRESGRIERLFGMKNGVEGLIRNDTVDLFDIFDCDEKLSILESTPAAALGSCRKKLPDYENDPEFYTDLFTYFHNNNIKSFVYIGGNDSMDTIKKLFHAASVLDDDVKFIGIPKTIDNDLVMTDHTPGFGSAAKYIAASVQEICRDCAVYTTKAVTIVEIMGRNAGWLTASSELPRLIGGSVPDLCYLPEVPFDEDDFLKKINALLEIKPNIVIAVSEGLSDKDGNLIGSKSQSGEVDVFGHSYLSGTGKSLELLVKKEIGCKVRSVEVNILQRCAAHLLSACDISESVEIGKRGAIACADGMTGKMACFKRCPSKDYKVDIEFEPIDDIANNSSLVPRDFINEDGTNVNDSCLEHILPLIQGEVKVKFNSGIPVHIAI